MSLRVLIVDDEPLAIDRTRLALQNMQGVTIAGEARSGAEALRLVTSLKPDTVLLDIQMPGGSGIDVARKLQGLVGAPEVIFVTAFDTFAAEAFALDASDYLLKPIRTDRLFSAMTRTMRRIEARRAGKRIAELELTIQTLRSPETKPGATFDEEIWVPRPGGVSRVMMENVIWIEAARDYLLIHTVHRSFMLRDTMGKMGKRLDPSRLMRVHRSAFVNKAKIESATRVGRDGVVLTLINGAIVRVGATYRGAVLSAMGGAIPNRSSRSVEEGA